MAVFDSPQVSVGAKLQEKTLTSNDTYAPDLGYNGFSEVTVNVPSPQVTELPVASAEEEGNIYQYVGTTDANYTNGYFYKCVSDGAVEPTYSWTNINVQAGGGSSLPDQTGQSGKFLVTDGTNASWSNEIKNQDIKIYKTGAFGSNTIVFGYTTSSSDTDPINPIHITEGAVSWNGNNNPVLKLNAQSAGKAGLSANRILPYSNDAEIGIGGSEWTVWNKIYVTKINNGGTNSSDITVPATSGTMVVADTTGATEGQVLTLDSNLNAVWATGGGGSSYTAGTGIDITNNVISTTDPVLINNKNESQENSIWIDSYDTEEIFADYTIVIGKSSTAVNPYSITIGTESYSGGGISIGNNVRCSYGVSIGNNSSSTVYNGGSGTAIGEYAQCYDNGIAIGQYAKTEDCDSAIQIGKGTNNEEGTLKVAVNTGFATDYINYKLMDSDGTIPTDRFTTTPTTDGTYNATITVADGVVTRSWSTGGSGGGISDVKVNGTSVVSGGVATITMPTIDDTSTTSTTNTWSASKLNTVLGDIESLINAL